MAALDGTDRIEAILSDGSRLRVDALQTFNRKQDWAVIVGGPSENVSQAIAAGGSTKVGDRCYSLEGAVNGSRVLVDGAVTGQLNAPASGGRLIVQWINGSGMPGAPVMNEFGEIVGIVGGTLVPGTSSIGELLHFRAELKGVPVIPQMLVRMQPNAVAASLADLRASGAVLPALQGNEHVLNAGFALKLQKGTTAVGFSDQRDEFAAAEKTFIAFISWNAQARVKGSLILRLVDDANRTVAESKPSKLDLRASVPVVSKWDLTIPTVAGWYRADFLLDGKPVYRAFVKISG
jgi:hypothetical protein